MVSNGGKSLTFPLTVLLPDKINVVNVVGKLETSPNIVLDWFKLVLTELTSNICKLGGQFAILPEQLEEFDLSVVNVDGNKLISPDKK